MRQGIVDAPASTLVNWLFEGIEEHASWNKLVMESVKLQVNICVALFFTLFVTFYCINENLLTRTLTKIRISSTSRQVHKAAGSLLREISLFCDIAINAAIITSAVACPLLCRQFRIVSIWSGKRIDREKRNKKKKQKIDLKLKFG